MDAILEQVQELEITPDSALAMQWEASASDPNPDDAIVAAIEAENRLAADTTTSSLDMFLELLSGADPAYLPPEAVMPASPIQADWNEVKAMLANAQDALRALQEYLVLTLETLGVEDAENMRLYEDHAGNLRLAGGHPRQEEIEAALNGQEHAELKNLYRASMAGMAFAGGLVGDVAVPDAVTAMVQGKISAA